MGKKMKLLPALFKHKEAAERELPWQWPSCKHPKTLSFRAGDDVFKTVNSMFFDPNPDETPAESSWFTTSSSSESASFSTESADQVDVFDGETLEILVKGARSERLFFEPGGDTSSILEKAKDVDGFRFKESVVFAMESADPYLDFRRSMEEMVETHGIKDWECLEELLAWYLKVNGKKNHDFIISAFVDLLVGLSSSSSSTSCSDNSSTTYYSSAISSLPSSPLSSTLGDHVNNEIEEEENTVLP